MECREKIGNHAIRLSVYWQRLDMSQVLTNNATKLAQSGEFSYDEPDFLLVQELVYKLAQQKHGGFNYQPGVLFTKVATELKARAGKPKNSSLPTHIAGKLRDFCNGLAITCHNKLVADGFVPVRQSAIKAQPDFRNTRRVRRVSEISEKLLDFATQLKDNHMDIVFLQEQIHKLESKQPKDSEESQRIESAIERLTDRKERLEKLGRSIAAEEAYQQEQLKKEQGSASEPTGPA